MMHKRSMLDPNKDHDVPHLGIYIQSHSFCLMDYLFSEIWNYVSALDSHEEKKTTQPETRNIP